MAPCLEDCPTEIIETIVVLLHLDDIRSLRQSCRSLAAKTSHNHFRSFFLSKRVIISEAALRTFVQVTQPGRLGCLVQDLILVGLANSVERDGSTTHVDSDDSDDSDERAVALLTQAFNGIALNGNTGKLSSVSLQIEVVQNDSEKRLLPAAMARNSWKFIWPSTGRTFHAVMRAFAASQLQFKTLNVFSQLQRCSLACNELARLGLQEPGLAVSLSSLKSLSISLSNRIIEPSDSPRGSPRHREEERLIRSARAKATTQANFVGLVRFLQLAHGLKDLEIHYYKVIPFSCIFKGSSYGCHPLLLRLAAKSKSLPKLIQCKLRGICITESDLLALLKRTGPRCLLLDNLTLSSGTFRSIFDYCTSETAGMEELYFDWLSEKHEYRKLLYFHGGPRPGMGLPPTSLRKVGAEVREPIISYYQPMSVDTPQTRIVHQQHRNEYGPA